MTVRPVSAADAPKALKGRTLRRAWASEVNRVLRATGDLEAAREAGAELAVAAIDCDAGMAAHRKRAGGTWGEPPPFTLSKAAKQRDQNVDGAGDRVRDAIMRDEVQPFAAADKKLSQMNHQRETPSKQSFDGARIGR